MKKLCTVVFIFVAAFVVVFSFANCSGKDDGKATDEGLEYFAIDGGAAYSVAKGGQRASNIIVPASHNGKPVRKVESFADYSELQSIVIPDSVTEISYAAFKGCGNLSEITVPFVGRTMNDPLNNAFDYIFGSSGDSMSVARVTVTGGNIAARAFVGWRFLTAVDIAGGAGRDTGSRTTSIGQYAFQNCGYLTNVIIASTVTTFVGYAFSGCSGALTIGVRGYASKPTGWDSYWNYTGSAYCSVTWNYTGVKW